jgi:hypothetical protein
MARPTTPQEAVDEAFLQPKSVSEEGRSFTNRDLRELQDARDRELAETAGKKNHFGLRFTKLVPPGAG